MNLITFRHHLVRVLRYNANLAYASCYMASCAPINIKSKGQVWFEFLRQGPSARIPLKPYRKVESDGKCKLGSQFPLRSHFHTTPRIKRPERATRGSCPIYNDIHQVVLFLRAVTDATFRAILCRWRNGIEGYN